MAANRKILVLPGDGIGPEVMAQVQRVIDWFDNKGSVRFEVTEDLVGGACYDSHGVSIREETMEIAVSTDAVLFGAVGGPSWDDVPREHRPEAGLLRLRKDLDLFANLRPAIVLDAMVESSTLKSEIVKGLDIIILRELTSGVYFGEPRGEQIMDDGTKRVVDTQAYTEDEIVRILRVAFELARQRKNRVHCAEKSNVMETGVFWRQISESVTDNLFGDILSDEAAMMTGSLGMLPSASLGNPDPVTGKRYAMYEPVHGSAPDIAGEGKANPLAMLLSFSMMLRYSFDLPEEADRVETVVQNVLNEGFRTGDIMQDGCHLVSTEEMGSNLLLELDRSLQ